MNVFLLVALGIWLLIIAYQDFTTRTITLYAFIGLLSFSLIAALSVTLFCVVLKNFASILFFLLFMLATLTGYFFLRYKRLINIFDSKIGVGDLLFLIAVASLFSLPAFLIFLIGSLICALVYQLMIGEYRQEAQVPLAGIQSVCLLFLLLLNTFWLHQPYPFTIALKTLDVTNR